MKPEPTIMRLIHDDLARAEHALSLERFAGREHALRAAAAVRSVRRAERAARRAERAAMRAGRQLAQHASG